MENIHISLSAETLFNLWGLPITNTLITSWVVILILLLVAFIVGRNPKILPNKIQVFFEMTLEFILNYMTEVLGNKKTAQKYFPLIATIFFFILFANILEFTPGIGSIGFFSQGAQGGEKFIPLFKSVNTDLNTPLALAIISFLVIEISGVILIGFLKYFGKFVNFSSPIGFFVGIIELFSEIARLISFSFRLFGNIFAGEVMILIASAFIPWIFPVPFMLFEVLVGIVQAAIFALLTLFFIKIATSESH